MESTDTEDHLSMSSPPFYIIDIAHDLGEHEDVAQMPAHSTSDATPCRVGTEMQI